MSKECKRISVELSAYFDGELEGADLQTVEEHLQSCTGCLAGLDKLNKLRSAFGSILRPPKGNRSILDDIKATLGEELENKSAKKPLVS